MIILVFIVFYILFVFFDLRLIVPYIGFGIERLPKEIPLEWLNVIEKLNKESKTNLEFLKNSYEYITNRYEGSRIKTIIKCLYAFEPPFKRKRGYLPCTLQNELLQMLLIRSGRFKFADVRVKETIVNLFIHQYLEVRIDNNWISVDPWAKSLGVPFGKSAFLFA